MTLREFELGEDHPEGVLSEESSPDGTKEKVLSSFDVAYHLLPTDGRYDYAMFHVRVRQIESSEKIDREDSDNFVVFPATAEIKRTGEWGYDMRLFSTQTKGKIGRLQVNPPFDSSDQIAEGLSITLAVEIEYDQEFTKEKKDYSESDIEDKRSATEEMYEEWQREYY